MAQGDAYVYTWTSYNNNVLTLQPSSGVEWMFTSHQASYASSGNGVGMNVTYGQMGFTKNDYSGYTGTGTGQYTKDVYGVYGLNPFNIKVIATNGKPHYYSHYNYSSTIYSRYCAIVINE